MIIGITGGIGSGKSVISHELRRMGYQVYDTDSEAKRLIVKDAHVRQQIESLFGPEVYQDGIYQTHIVAQKVFNATASKLQRSNLQGSDLQPEERSTGKSDLPPLLAQLNAIVHPAVRADILHQHSNSPQSDLFFIECAILYTAHLDTICDKVVVITAPEEVRIKRVIARDHSDIEKVRARMHAQQIESDLQRADITINNDGFTPISELCQQLLCQLH